MLSSLINVFKNMTFIKHFLNNRLFSYFNILLKLYSLINKYISNYLFIVYYNILF